MQDLKQNTKGAFRVKRNIRRRIESAKRKIERRLADAVHVNEWGPVMCGSPRYEVSEKVQANPWGGLGVIQRMVLKLKLADRINEVLHLLKIHVPYHESDHVLNIAYNVPTRLTAPPRRAVKIF